MVVKLPSDANGIIENTLSMIDMASETILTFIHKGPLMGTEIPDCTGPNATLEDRRLAYDMLRDLFDMTSLLWSALYTLEYSQQELDRAAKTLLTK